jgi:hypothetical protein
MNWVDGEGVLNYELRMKKRGEWGGGRRTVRRTTLRSSGRIKSYLAAFRGVSGKDRNELGKKEVK